MNDRREIDALIDHAYAVAIAAAPFCGPGLEITVPAAVESIKNKLHTADVYDAMRAASDKSADSANVPFWATSALMWGVMLSRHCTRWNCAIPGHAYTALDMIVSLHNAAHQLHEALCVWYGHCRPSQTAADNLRELREALPVLSKSIERYQRLMACQRLG